MTDPARQEKLERLFSSHYSAVRSYAERRVPSELVDDVVARTFVVVWRKLDRVPTDSLPWLLAVTRNVAATERRGDARRRSLVSKLKRVEAGESYDLASPGEGGSPVLEALSRLSARYREAITLTAWEGLTPAEAAVVVNQPATAFRVRLHRARKQLKRELEGLLASEAQAYTLATKNGLLEEGSRD